MREAASVLGLMILLVVVGVLSFAPWGILYEAGMAVTAAGLAVGLPSTAMYHLRLRQRLLEVNDLPRGWYWRPLELHDRVASHARTEVVAWSYVGAAGFVVICVGLVMLSAALVKVLRTSTFAG